MAGPNPTESETLDETLVAYLDGELDTEAAQQIEHRLGSEEPVRVRLRELAQTWDLLDYLPTAVADESFARTTVEMAAIDAERELKQNAAGLARRRLARWIAGAAAIAAALSTGFLISRVVWSNPNDTLLRDLSLVQNVELYRQAGDIDFLRRLNDENLFSDEAEAARDETGSASPGLDKNSTPGANRVPSAIALAHSMRGANGSKICRPPIRKS